jgi:AcrR family transcriptional regulator
MKDARSPAMLEPFPPGLEGSTRDRLLAAGMRLFPEKGFRRTSVGDIEAAAGLRPRAGAMYHHFSSKQNLLEAAAAAHLAVLDHQRRQLESLPQLHDRTDALLVGRFLLAQLDVVRNLMTMLERDGDRLPGLQSSIQGVIETGHCATEELIRRCVDKRVPGKIDIAAFAVVVFGSLVNVRRHEWTFGASPLGVADDRLLAAWAETCAALAQTLGRDLE